MRIIEPSVDLDDEIDPAAIMRKIELAGRVCYKSECAMSDEADSGFIRRIVASGHESVIEHASVTLRVICDRGVTHEIVRHRIASYSQESTRYCNYAKDKFGNQITVIRPCFWQTDSREFEIWKAACETAERAYFDLLARGASPQEARDVLPNSLKTELVITMNIREWRHFLKLRTDARAHPQMRQIAVMIYGILYENLPVFFEDIQLDSAKSI